MKITLQQCIFLVSNLNKKQQQILQQITGQYMVPLSVNGKDVVDKKKSEEMKQSLLELDILVQDMLTLKNAIHIANTQHKIKKMTLAEALEKTRTLRTILNQLDYALSLSYNKVETGVGVVQYGPMNESLLKERQQALEKEVNALSSAIDQANASITIDVKLQGEYS